MAEASDAGVRYRNKVTIVTGGGAGIGKGCVEVFVKHGSKVVIAEVQENLGKEVEKAVNETGPGEAIFVKCDVTNEDDVKNLVETTVAKYGQIDCVINNAGKMLLEKVDTLTVEKVRQLNEVNIIGPFLVSKYTLPHLRKVKGNIINISSTTAVLGQRAAPAYAATKAASVGFTKTLAIDEAANGVRVNSVAPGPTWTALFDTFLERFKHQAATEFYTKQETLLGRLGQPQEVGLACLYFATDATFCTGAVLHVSGGCELDYGIKSGIEGIFEEKDPSEYMH